MTDPFLILKHQLGDENLENFEAIQEMTLEEVETYMSTEGVITNDRIQEYLTQAKAQ
jgi:hypothetical protein